MTTKRPTFDKFQQTALQDPEVRAEYEALSTAFEMKRQMIALRKKAGVTQEQMADLLGTKKATSRAWKACTRMFHRDWLPSKITPVHSAIR